MAKVWMSLGLMAALSGCGPPETPSGGGGTAMQRADVATRPDGANASTATLLDRGVRAMQDGRITRPVGDSAVDLFVTLHGREPDNATVRAALVELQPYVLLASERAIAGGDVEDAERLVGALAMFDPDAVPLPRLRADLEEVRRRVSGAAMAADREAANIDTETIAMTTGQPLTPESRIPAPPAGPADGMPVEASATKPEPEPHIASEPTPVPDEPLPIAVVPPAPVPRPAPQKPATVNAPPRLVHDVAPDYPLSAMRRGLSGRVRLEFTVRPDGGVADVSVVASAPQGMFDDAALAAARQWRFEPRSAPTTSVRELLFDVRRR